MHEYYFSKLAGEFFERICNMHCSRNINKIQWFYLIKMTNWIYKITQIYPLSIIKEYLAASDVRHEYKLVTST